MADAGDPDLFRAVVGGGTLGLWTAKALAHLGWIADPDPGRWWFLPIVAGIAFAWACLRLAGRRGTGTRA